MKFTMAQGDLLSVLKRVCEGIEKRNSIPILDCVRIKANDAGGVVTFTGTDLDNEISIVVGADVAAAGEACARARAMLQIVEALSEPVTIEQEGDHPVTLTSGNAHFTDHEIGALPVRDHPVFPSFAIAQQFVLAVPMLWNAIETVKFAISTEETRYYLNGICLHALIKDGKTWLRFVATNGHQLAWCDVPAPHGLTVLGMKIVPRATVRILSALLEGHVNVVHVEIGSTGDNKIAFRLGDIVLKAKLIDGTFPDYARVIPTEPQTEIVFEAEAIHGAVKRMTAVLADHRPIVFGFESVDAALSVRNHDGVQAHERVAWREIKGRGMEIGFYGRYIANILERCSDRVVLKLTDSSSPAIVECPSRPEIGFVLMPMMRV